MSNDLMSMERLGKQFVFTAKTMKERFERVLGEHGSSLQHFLMLSSLQANPGQSQRELADTMGIMGPTMTHHLDRFEQDGVIVREPDPTDRRVTRVRLTAAGRRQHKRIVTVVDRHDAALRQTLGEHDATELQRILSRLQDHFAQESHV